MLCGTGVLLFVCGVGFGAETVDAGVDAHDGVGEIGAERVEFVAKSGRGGGRGWFGSDAHAETRTLKPPQLMRVQSKGIFFGSEQDSAMRGSFMTLAFTRSRWARDL